MQFLILLFPAAIFSLCGDFFDCRSCTESECRWFLTNKSGSCAKKAKNWWAVRSVVAKPYQCQDHEKNSSSTKRNEVGPQVTSAPETTTEPPTPVTPTEPPNPETPTEPSTPETPETEPLATTTTIPEETTFNLVNTPTTFSHSIHPANEIPTAPGSTFEEHSLHPTVSTVSVEHSSQSSVIENQSFLVTVEPQELSSESKPTQSSSFPTEPTPTLSSPLSMLNSTHAIVTHDYTSNSYSPTTSFQEPSSPLATQLEPTPEVFDSAVTTEPTFSSATPAELKSASDTTVEPPTAESAITTTSTAIISTVPMRFNTSSTNIIGKEFPNSKNIKGRDGLLFKLAFIRNLILKMCSTYNMVNSYKKNKHLPPESRRKLNNWNKMSPVRLARCPKLLKKTSQRQLVIVLCQVHYATNCYLNLEWMTDQTRLKLATWNEHNPLKGADQCQHTENFYPTCA